MYKLHRIERKVMLSQLEMMWKKAVVANFKTLCLLKNILNCVLSGIEWKVTVNEMGVMWKEVVLVRSKALSAW